MNHIVIVGAGGIGRAAALIILNDKEINAKVSIGDINQKALDSARNWIAQGNVNMEHLETFLMPMDGLNEKMSQVFNSGHVVLDCLPGSQAPRIAGYAKDMQLHYANLTEYVQETKDIIELAKDAKTGFLLQTGLAPGYINIMARHIYNNFCAKFNVEKVLKISMKVGALTKHAIEPHFYGFTWSPIGVATEYVKDSEVIKDGKVKLIAALSGIKSLMIDGVWYEDNYTSGGAADLPQAFEGKTENLYYKTLRYPGHYAWVKSILNQAPYSKDRIEYLNDYMLNTIPSYDEDVVILYSEVQGKDKFGTLRSLNKSLRINPMSIGNQYLKAIQSTTASALVESARFLLEQNSNGVILQSQIDTEDFLSGRFVTAAYGNIVTL